MPVFADIARIFEELELRLIASLKSNLSLHKKWEKTEGFQWSAWQAEKIRNLEKFRKENLAILNGYRGVIDNETRALMEEQFLEGERLAENDVLAADADMPLPGSGVKGNISRASPVFFGADRTKLSKLMEDITNIEVRAETAALRMTDDVYRQTLNRVQLAIASGAMTVNQAIDLAVRDFLDKGINCIVYKDGRRVNIADYIRMALRTTSTRAQLQGMAQKARELGYDTVLVSQYGMCSETCLPWQGRVYIDDVFASWGGERLGERGKSLYCGKWFPLLSTAVHGGLFHPNCRHTINVWIDGVSEMPKPLDEKEIKRRSELEQKQRRLENDIRKAKRLVEGSSDRAHIAENKRRLREAQRQLKEFIDSNSDVLRRDYGREKVYTADVPKNVDKSGGSGIIEAYRSNGIMVVSKEGISQDVVERAHHASENVSNDFPILRKRIESIDFGNTDDALGINKFMPSTGRNTITLSESAFSNPAGLSKILLDDFNSGLSYETDCIESLVAHEMGHAAHIAFALKRSGIEYGKPLSIIEQHIFEQEYNKIAQDIYIAAFSDESIMEIFSKCTKELGSMTTGRANELIAQSFGNYYYGKTKSAIAASIVEYFKKELV